MRWVFSIIYAAALVAGLCWILTRTDAQRLAFQATRNFPANHLLQDGDVQPVSWYRPDLFFAGPSQADFVGHYLMGTIHAGEALRRDETSPTPALTVAEPTVWLAVPAPRNLVKAGQIDVGQVVTICKTSADRRNKANIQIRATVIVILCPDIETASCTAVLERAPGNVASIMMDFGKNNAKILFNTDSATCR